MYVSFFLSSCSIYKYMYTISMFSFNYKKHCSQNVLFIKCFIKQMLYMELHKNDKIIRKKSHGSISFIYKITLFSYFYIQYLHINFFYLFI